MSDTALLVLDMVNRFDFEGGDRLAKAARAIVPRIETLRARFDAAGAPTIYVNDNFSHWQGQFGDLVAACRDAGGASASIVQRLAPRPHDYHVLKPKHSGFLATPLAILLAKLGARRLVLTGDTELGLTVRNLLDRLPWQDLPLAQRIALQRGSRLLRAAREQYHAGATTGA